MKIKLLVLGKTDQKYLIEGCSLYEKRIRNYLSFDVEYIVAPKQFSALSGDILKNREGELFIKRIDKGDFIVLLDEKGKKFNSKEFAAYFEKKMIAGTRKLVFCVGGAFGFGDNIKAIAKELVSLSDMTFSHQLIRLLFMEQLYRALTIIRNEPYHNE